MSKLDYKIEEKKTKKKKNVLEQLQTKTKIL